MKSARLLLPSILVVVVAVASACGSPIPQAKFNGVSVGMALSAGDRGDQGINGLSAGGLDRAKHRLGTRIKLAYLNTQGDDRSRALDNLLAARSNPVIALGDHYAEELTVAAAKHPAISFAVMDSATPTAPNIT
ncbi:MAG TPA: hypothetical protein VHU91_04175, partial [Mycobacteriales bacterium]|nr:hypothetical protein [Mycobacteriales bacterium]